MTIPKIKKQVRIGQWDETDTTVQIDYSKAPKMKSRYCLTIKIQKSNIL